MIELDVERIKSWYLALVLAGYTQEQAYQLIAEAIRDERMAAA